MSDGTLRRLSESLSVSHSFEPPTALSNRHTQSILASSPLRKRMIARKAAALISNSSPQILISTRGVRLLGFFSPAPRRPRGLAT